METPLHPGCTARTPVLRARGPSLKGQSELRTRGDEMAWVALVAAGLFETAFAVCLKLSDGLRVFWPTVGFAAYAVWTGIGAAGAAAAGMIFLGDAVSTVKLVSIALILAGVVGLNLSGVTP